MTRPSPDPFDLDRFVKAQALQYEQALRELRAGRKQSHWIWFVLPQLRGLGSSFNAEHYGIGSTEEASAYLAHPVLGPRLTQCVEAVCAHRGKGAAAILGELDAAKYRSCLTLFAAVTNGPSVFEAALEQHFAGVPDRRTVELLASLRGAAD